MSKPAKQQPKKRWCKKCKVLRPSIIEDIGRDAWTCEKCKTVTTGLEQVQLRHQPE